MANQAKIYCLAAGSLNCYALKLANTQVKIARMELSAEIFIASAYGMKKPMMAIKARTTVNTRFTIGSSFE